MYNKSILDSVYCPNIYTVHQTNNMIPIFKGKHVRFRVGALQRENLVQYQTWLESSEKRLLFINKFKGIKFQAPQQTCKVYKF